MENKTDPSPRPYSGRKERERILIFIIAVCLVTGILYWPVPYPEIDGSPSFFKQAAVAFLGGTVAMTFLKRGFFFSSVAVTAGSVLAVVIRVIYDIVFYDPTSHNLWPIELFFSVLLIFPVAAVGAAIGYSIFFLIKKR